LNVVAAIRNGFCRSAFSTRICAANIVSAIGRVSRQSAKRSWRRCPSVPDGAIGWHDGGGKAGAAFHGDNGSYRLSANGVTGIKAEHHLPESPARRKLVKFRSWLNHKRVRTHSSLPTPIAGDGANTVPNGASQNETSYPQQSGRPCHGHLPLAQIHPDLIHRGTAPDRGRGSTPRAGATAQLPQKTPVLGARPFADRPELTEYSRCYR